MYRVDEALQEFLESGVAVIVGTADSDGRPHVRPGWGPRVHPSRTRLSVFMEAERAPVPLEDIASTGQIAVTCSDPITYRSVQLKGHGGAVSDVTSDDEEWVARHRAAFIAAVAVVGDAPQGARNRWIEGPLVRFDFDVERAFNQTPGPGAGGPL
jgi:hypothetical protein